MHTLTIKLKQHTPLIHFQHDQDGATLRASEVKPKLDKYILNKLKETDEYDKGDQEGWINCKNEKEWLDYKMVTELVGKSDDFLVSSNINRKEADAFKKANIRAIGKTPFFAQEEQKRDIAKSKTLVEDWNKIEKKGLYVEKGASEEPTTNMIHFFSRHLGLLEKIADCIQSFFSVKNFGTRQNKGFGCFEVLGIELNDSKIAIKSIEDALKEYDGVVYFKKLDDIKWMDVSEQLTRIFSQINSDYIQLKTGVNYTYQDKKTGEEKHVYKKSLLFCHAVNNMDGNPRWEKRLFKKEIRPLIESKGYTLRAKQKQKDDEELNEPICDAKGYQSWEDPVEGYNYKYVRSVLGLAEHYEFLLDKDGYESKDKAIVKIDDEDVERFNSPITFKVYNNCIYLLGEEPTKILGSDIHYYYALKINKDTIPLEFEIVDGKQKIKKRVITVPDNFSLEKFLDYGCKRINYTKIK